MGKGGDVILLGRGNNAKKSLFQSTFFFLASFKTCYRPSISFLRTQPRIESFGQRQKNKGKAES